MSDTLKAISIVTTIHQCFTQIRDLRPAPLPRRMLTFWKRPIEIIDIRMEKNYTIAHRALPYLEAIVVGPETSQRARDWVNDEIEIMTKSLKKTGHSFVVDAGSLEVVFEVETTEDGTVYGFLVQKTIPRRIIR